MTLRFNSKTNDFVVVSNDEDRANSVGLTLSTKVRGSAGEKVWFTQAPYAALAYYKDGDPAAQAKT